MDDQTSLVFTCLICHFWNKWHGNIPSCAYVHPQVNLQCDNCFKCMHAPRELLAHVQSHGHPIGHLLSSYRSRSPRESVVELASAASYVPESLAPSRDTSVFDDASYASSRVIAADIHSPPRSVISQMPTASAQPLAQSTQVPQAYPFIPTTVPLAQSPLSVHSPAPPRGNDVMSLRDQLQRTTAHWCGSLPMLPDYLVLIPACRWDYTSLRPTWPRHCHAAPVI